ncbi:hypothetical protein GCM10029964_056930 [Kibdelosporangium lantanae]
MVGKVCGDETCDDSAILAGMEWAAVEQHAKVINLSLGSDDGSDGTDPLSEAVNTLTARTGSLFVIAAGNSGAPGTVGTRGRGAHGRQRGPDRQAQRLLQPGPTDR